MTIPAHFKTYHYKSISENTWAEGGEGHDAGGPLDEHDGVEGRLMDVLVMRVGSGGKWRYI